MKKLMSVIPIVMFILLPVLLFSVTLEQFISKEDAKFDILNAKLTIGEDGNAYMYSDTYLQRLSLDGAQRKGSVTVYSTRGATANKNGLMATANAHFNHSVNLWSDDFKNIYKVQDFLVNDTVEFHAPFDVQTDGVNFYGLDQNRDRILKISEDGRVLSAYPLSPTGETFVGGLLRFKVCADAQLFYIASMSHTLYALNFDGTIHYKLENAGMGGNPWDGFDKIFDADSDGTLYIINARNDSRVYIYDKNANQIGIVPLQFGERQGMIISLEKYGGEYFVKRRADRVTLFEVYDANTGVFKRVIYGDVEILTVNYPKYVWITGEKIPIEINLNSGGKKMNPRWKVALRLFNDSKWVELPFVNGEVTVPNDLAGLYHVKVYDGSDYFVEDYIEVKKAGTNLTAAVMSQNNRVYWGKGERIPIIVKFRQTANLPESVVIEMKDERGNSVVKSTVAVRNGVAQTGLTESMLSKLAVGRYVISATANGVSCMEQPIVLGPGVPKRNLFSVVQHGDYTSSMSFYRWSDEPVRTPEYVSQMLQRAGYLGINLYMDRFGHGGAGMLASFTDKRNFERILADIRSRLEGDETSFPPEKLMIELPIQQYVGGYSSQGIEEVSILLYMDAGLPHGTSYDSRTDAQLDEAITLVTNDLKRYPGFRGWNWAANWWPNNNYAYNSLSPEKLAQFNAALKVARESGKWNPILEEVAAIYMNWPLNADKLFTSIMNRESTGLSNIMTGPYRQQHLLPSIAFSLAKEVDLHYQAEQVRGPQTAMHEVDYYKRDGKRATIHPELWNDSGTGDFVYTTLFQVLARGADSVGISGDPSGVTQHANSIRTKTDVRGTTTGTVSVIRNIFNLANEYGEWSTQLTNENQIAIPVSTRIMSIDVWDRGLGNEYFSDLFEAWNSCMYAHRPAKFVFTEDIKPGTLSGYKAILLVHKTMELDTNIVRGLEEARRANVPIYADKTCRPEIVRGATMLDISFNKVSADRNTWQDDSAYIRISNYFRENSKILREAFSNIPAVMECDNINITLSERKNGDGRFIWAIRNQPLELEYGDIWRIGLIMASQTPLVADMTLSANGGTVYDVFSGTELGRNADELSIKADFINVPARLYAVLPAPIESVVLRANNQANFGQAYNFAIEVQDTAKKMFNTVIPVRYQLLDASGNILAEDYTFTPALKPFMGQVSIPLNIEGTKAKLVATELISGKEASIEIALTNRRTLSFTAADTVTAAVMPNTAVTGLNVGSFGKVEDRFGVHIRDISIADDNKTAIMNTMNFDENLYSIDLESGQTLWSKRVGNHFAYAPKALKSGAAVQGFDLNTAEGYHMYLLDSAGNMARKFATFGLTKRATNWSTASILLDRINNFAVAEDGGYVVASGDLGLAVWDGQGRELWKQDWWKSERKRVYVYALDDTAFIALDMMKATCYNAVTGAVVWEHTLDNTGQLESMVKAKDSNVIALYSTTKGGKIYVLRDGKLVNSFNTYADMMELSPDGNYLAVTNDAQLRYYNVEENIQWAHISLDNVRNPAISPDGKRIAFSDDVGLLFVFDTLSGKQLYTEDLKGLPVPKWLADGSLIVGTWNGKLVRYDNNYKKVWERVPRAATAVNYEAKRVENIPITRVANVSNAEAVPNMDVENNILRMARPMIGMFFDPIAHEDPKPWLNSVEKFYDKDTAPLENPWINWSLIQFIDSGWVGRYTFEINMFNKQMEITGITFHEDPKYPESWLRDIRLEYWDPIAEEWKLGPYMVSDAVVHTHMFDKPVSASKIRFVSTGGGSWPISNIRLTELVLHGSVTGASHPDVVAKKPAAVLFDEKDSDLMPYTVMRSKEWGIPYVIQYDDAFSGGKSIALTDEGGTAPQYIHEYGGHVTPGWLFDIVENPQPGQYRYIQFAIKGLSKDTRQASILLTGAHLTFGGKDDIIGTLVPVTVVADTIPSEWTTVRADLWMLNRNRDFVLNSISIVAKGGGVALDQIVLARTLEDLPPQSENGYN